MAKITALMENGFHEYRTHLCPGNMFSGDTLSYPNA
jgi:hypothetical protein